MTVITLIIYGAEKRGQFQGSGVVKGEEEDVDEKGREKEGSKIWMER